MQFSRLLLIKLSTIWSCKSWNTTRREMSSLSLIEINSCNKMLQEKTTKTKSTNMLNNFFTTSFYEMMKSPQTYSLCFGRVFGMLSLELFNKSTLKIQLSQSKFNLIQYCKIYLTLANNDCWLANIKSLSNKLLIGRF